MTTKRISRNLSLALVRAEPLEHQPLELERTNGLTAVCDQSGVLKDTLPVEEESRVCDRPSDGPYPQNMYVSNSNKRDVVREGEVISGAFAETGVSVAPRVTGGDSLHFKKYNNKKQNTPNVHNHTGYVRHEHFHYQQPRVVESTYKGSAYLTNQGLYTPQVPKYVNPAFAGVQHSCESFALIDNYFCDHRPHECEIAMILAIIPDLEILPTYPCDPFVMEFIGDNAPKPEILSDRFDMISVDLPIELTETIFEWCSGFHDNQYPFCVMDYHDDYVPDMTDFCIQLFGYDLNPYLHLDRCRKGYDRRHSRWSGPISFDQIAIIDGCVMDMVVPDEVDCDWDSDDGYFGDEDVASCSDDDTAWFGQAVDRDPFTIEFPEPEFPTFFDDNEDVPMPDMDQAALEVVGMTAPQIWARCIMMMNAYNNLPAIPSFNSIEMKVWNLMFTMAFQTGLTLTHVHPIVLPMEIFFTMWGIVSAQAKLDPPNVLIVHPRQRWAPMVESWFNRGDYTLELPLCQTITGWEGQSLPIEIEKRPIEFFVPWPKDHPIMSNPNKNIRLPPLPKVTHHKPKIDRQAARDLKEGMSAKPNEVPRMTSAEKKRVRKFKAKLAKHKPLEGQAASEWFGTMFDTILGLILTVKENFMGMIGGSALAKIKSMFDALCDTKMWLSFAEAIQHFSSTVGNVTGFFTDTAKFMKENIVLSREVIAMVLGLVMRVIFGKLISQSGFKMLATYIAMRAMPADLWKVVSFMFDEAAKFITERFGDVLGVKASASEDVEARIHTFLRYNGTGGCPPPKDSPFHVADPCPVSSAHMWSILSTDLDKKMRYSYDSATKRRLAILRADMDTFYSNNKRVMGTVATFRAFGLAFVGPSGCGKTFMVNDVVACCAKAIFMDPADANINVVSGCTDPKFFPRMGVYDFCLLGDDLNNVRFDPNSPPLNGINVGFALMSGLGGFIPPSAELDTKKLPYSTMMYIQTANDEQLCIPQIFTPAAQAAAARRFTFVVKVHTKPEFMTNGFIDKKKLKKDNSHNVYDIGRYVVHQDGLGWSWEPIITNQNYDQMMRTIILAFREHVIMESESILDRIMSMDPTAASCLWCRGRHATDQCGAREDHTPEGMLSGTRPEADLGSFHKAVRLGLILKASDMEMRGKRAEQRSHDMESPINFDLNPPIPAESHISTYVQPALEGEGPNSSVTNKDITNAIENLVVPKINVQTHTYLCHKCTRVLHRDVGFLPSAWSLVCPDCEQLEVDDHGEDDVPPIDEDFDAPQYDWPRWHAIKTVGKHFLSSTVENPWRPNHNFNEALGAGGREFANSQFPKIFGFNDRNSFKHWKIEHFRKARIFIKRAMPGIQLLLLLGMCYKLGKYIYAKAPKALEFVGLRSAPPLEGQGNTLALMEGWSSKAKTYVYGEKKSPLVDTINEILMDSSSQGVHREHFERVLEDHVIKIYANDREMNAFAIGGELIVLPSHAVGLGPQTVIYRQKDPYSARQTFHVTEIKRINTSDLIMMRLPGLVGFRDCTKYFPLNVVKFSGVATFKGVKGPVTYETLKNFKFDGKMYPGGVGFMGAFATTKGDCGLPLYSEKGTCIIYGFHVAGSDGTDRLDGLKRSAAASVTKTDLDRCAATFKHAFRGCGDIVDTLVGQAAPRFKGIDDRHPNYQAFPSEFPGIVLGCLEGSVNQKGRMDETHPLLHAFCKAKLAAMGKVLEPAKLKKFVNADGDITDTFHDHYCNPASETVIWKESLAFPAVQKMAIHIVKFADKVEHPIFNKQINCPVEPLRLPDCEDSEFWNIMDFNTASGYEGGPKHMHLRKEIIDGRVKVYAKDPTLIVKANRIIATLRRRELAVPLVMMNTKDNEVRDPIKAGRGIYCYGLPMLIAARTVLAPMRWLFARFPFGMKCMVGVNPHSLDWEQMMLHFVHKYKLDGDFKKFDGSIAKPNWRFVALLFRIIYEHFDWPFKDVVDLMILSFIHCPIVWKNLIAYMFVGHTSGFMYTAELNSVMGWLIMTMVGIILGFEPDGQFYGDDNDIGMEEKVDLDLWVATWKELGMTMTSAVKNQPLSYKDWDTMTFLKRGFKNRVHGDLKFVAAPLELASIYKMGLYWVRPKSEKIVTPEGIMYRSVDHEHTVLGQIMDSMLREAGAHGETFYEEMRSALKPIIASVGARVLYEDKSYDDWIEEWKNGALTKHWEL